MNPSPSAQNPISQPLKKGKSQLPFYPFTTLYSIKWQLLENRTEKGSSQVLVEGDLIVHTLFKFGMHGLLRLFSLKP